MATTNKNPIPEALELRKMAEDLIHDQATMTLATAAEARAWAAPVYYVYVKAGFYFFSDPSSRHIQEAMASGRASAAIFARADTWQGIRGLQMSGDLERVSPGLHAAGVVRSYLKKFTFTEGFFKPGQSIDVGAFTERFKVRLYRFRPTLVYYMDNEIRFGFREEITLA